MADRDIVEVEIVEEDTLETESMVPALVSPQPAMGQVMSLAESRAQVNHIQHLMRMVMIEDTHYGVIPGCKKPSLLKPGAEKLGLVFRLGCRLRIKRRDMENNHREHTVICELFHIPTGQFVGEGIGSCSTLEKKYRYRTGGLQCPNCGERTIKQSQYGDKGWYCYAAIGGCNDKFKRGNKMIERQDYQGKIENPDIADCWNTVLKMAKKRAQVDAILSATAASDIFTQDVEDLESAMDADNSLGKPPDNGKARKPNRAPHTKQQRAANKKRPTAPAKAEKLKTRVEEIQSRDITSGPHRGLVRWWIRITQGIWLKTESETFAEVAEEGKNGAVVSYHYDDGEQYYILDEIFADPDIPTPASQGPGQGPSGPLFEDKHEPQT